MLDHDALPPVYYENELIAYAKKAKNLGVIIDCNLSWNEHINGVSKKLCFSFHSFKRLQKFLPFKTRLTLAQALLLSLLDYADISYLDANEELLNKLERLQNLCIRFIYGLRKYDHVSAYRTKLNWLPIRRCRDFHIMSFLYSVLYNPTFPSYLRERFDFLVPHDVSSRSTKSLILKLPSHSSTRYSGSFTVHAARLWNSLPISIRESQSLNIFKSRLKEHLLSL